MRFKLTLLLALVPAAGGQGQARVDVRLVALGRRCCSRWRVHRGCLRRRHHSVERGAACLSTVNNTGLRRLRTRRGEGGTQAVQSVAVMWIRVSNLMKVISQTPRASLEAELDQSVVSPFIPMALSDVSSVGAASLAALSFEKYLPGLTP